jgi:hypothetical protein
MDQDEVLNKIVHTPDQWQKSLDTTQRVSSLAKYGARIDPKVASDRCEIAPTTMGTILMSCLFGVTDTKLR